MENAAKCLNFREKTGQATNTLPDDQPKSTRGRPGPMKISDLHFVPHSVPHPKIHLKKTSFWEALFMPAFLNVISEWIREFSGGSNCTQKKYVKGQRRHPRTRVWDASVELWSIKVRRGFRISNGAFNASDDAGAIDKTHGKRKENWLNDHLNSFVTIHYNSGIPFAEYNNFFF